MPNGTRFRSPMLHVGVLFLGVALVCGLGCQDTQDATVVEDRPETATPDAVAPEPSEGREEAMGFQITSSAFGNGQTIPAKHTADGVDVSPPLAWANVPEGTKSFVLLCDDPDAPVGNWVHWVAYGIPVDTQELPEGVPTDEVLPSGIKQGVNDFRKAGYGGPSPPPGKAHRYFFTLYALDADVSLGPGARKKVLMDALEGHILGKAQLMGTYGR